MNLSRYILKYSKEDIMKVKVNNKFDDKMNAKPRVFNYNCDCK